MNDEEFDRMFSRSVLAVVILVALCALAAVAALFAVLVHYGVL